MPERDSPVYYRLYRPEDGEPVVVTMQWFDEYDYVEHRFLNGCRYDTLDEAHDALRAISDTHGPRVVECGCPRLRGEDVECPCGVDCAACWPWAHEGS